MSVTSERKDCEKCVELEINYCWNASGEILTWRQSRKSQFVGWCLGRGAATVINPVVDRVGTLSSWMATFESFTFLSAAAERKSSLIDNERILESIFFLLVQASTLRSIKCRRDNRLTAVTGKFPWLFCIITFALHNCYCRHDRVVHKL